MPAQVHLSGAHGARLAARVEHAAADLFSRETPDRLGHEIGFRMCGRVRIGVHRVLRGQRYSSINGEQRAKRVIARRSRLAGQFDGLSEQFFVNVHRNRDSSLDVDVGMVASGAMMTEH